MPLLSSSRALVLSLLLRLLHAGRHAGKGSDSSQRSSAVGGLASVSLPAPLAAPVPAAVADVAFRQIPAVADAGGLGGYAGRFASAACAATVGVVGAAKHRRRRRGGAGQRAASQRRHDVVPVLERPEMASSSRGAAASSSSRAVAPQAALPDEVAEMRRAVEKMRRREISQPVASSDSLHEPRLEQQSDSQQWQVHDTRQLLQQSLPEEAQQPQPVQLQLVAVGWVPVPVDGQDSLMYPQMPLHQLLVPASDGAGIGILPLVAPSPALQQLTVPASQAAGHLSLSPDSPISCEGGPISLLVNDNAEITIQNGNDKPASSWMTVSKVLAAKVVEELSSVGSPEQRAALDWIVESAWSLSCSHEGSRIVQKAFEVAQSSDLGALRESLRGHVMEALKSPHANHVLQKCIEMTPAAQLAFVTEEMQGNAVLAAKHRFGCRILERLIEHHCASLSTESLIDEIVSEASTLCRHSYANFVVQHVLEHGSVSQKARIVEVLLPETCRLAKHRVASHVVQSALVYASAEDKARLKKAMSSDSAELKDICNTTCGRFVVDEMHRV